MKPLLTLLLLLILGCRQQEVEVEKPEVDTLPSEATSSEITILAWNVESGGSDPKIIAEQLSEFGSIDIYCLSEVSPRDFTTYRQACGTEFASFDSQSSGGDRLQIIYDASRFDLLERRELSSYRDVDLNNGNHRSPLYVRLEERACGLEFVVMTNHFARVNGDLRAKQAIGLREWARDQAQDVGVINISDFNFDYDFHTQRGNDAFVEMLRDNIWVWVKPEPLIDTNWSDPDGDGRDNYPGSMLDFAFVAGEAREWSARCRVIVRDGDCPDDTTTSDHRPIELRMTIPRH